MAAHEICILSWYMLITNRVLKTDLLLYVIMNAFQIAQPATPKLSYKVARIAIKIISPLLPGCIACYGSHQLGYILWCLALKQTLIKTTSLCQFVNKAFTHHFVAATTLPPFTHI